MKRSYGITERGIKYRIYHRLAAASPELHDDGEWYFEPENRGSSGGDIFSPGYDTAEAAEEAARVDAQISDI